MNYNPQAWIQAYFGTFCVQIGQLFEAQWVFKVSKEFEIDDIFIRKTAICRSSSILQWLTLTHTQKLPKES